MSKSSNLIFVSLVGGFYRVSMKSAAPILFWFSLIIFAVTLASYWSVFFPSENDQTDAGTRAFLVFGGIAHALNSAALPFAGAAIVWAVNNNATGDTE